jgi:polyribonucleotide nucleotidyltransferase
LPNFDIPLATVIQHYPNEEKLAKPVDFNSFSLELILSATEEKIVMLEAKGKEVKEEKILNLINSAHQEIRSLIGFFRAMANSLGIKKAATEVPQIPPIRNEILTEKINSQLASMLFQNNLT